MDTVSELPLELERYTDQVRRWPTSGRHVMAQYDEEGVFVYQAYKPSIATYAVEHQGFGADFSFNRMSWVKPNFLWMMYRSGWATKDGQQRVLALRVKRAVFDSWLSNCVSSSFDRNVYGDRQAWQLDVKKSELRLQWDPDHDPSGQPLERRAVQLGIRGNALAAFRGEAFLAVHDVTEYVEAQREFAVPGRWEELVLPREEVYPVPDDARRRLGMPVDG